MTECNIYFQIRQLKNTRVNEYAAYSLANVALLHAGFSENHKYSILELGARRDEETTTYATIFPSVP